MQLVALKSQMFNKIEEQKKYETNEHVRLPSVECNFSDSPASKRVKPFMHDNDITEEKVISSMVNIDNVEKPNLTLKNLVD